MECKFDINNRCTRVLKTGDKFPSGSIQPRRVGEDRICVRPDICDSSEESNESGTKLIDAGKLFAGLNSRGC